MLGSSIQMAGTPSTLPATTFTGDITLGANKLKTTNLLLKEGDADDLVLRNAADNTYKNLVLKSINWIAAISDIGGGASIQAPNADNQYSVLKARDSGVGVVEIARFQGAADPYFQATLPMVLKPIATASLPATPVKGMLAYDDTANKLKVYNGTGWETVTSS